MDYFVGFFVGLLCGVIPLTVGLLTKHKILGIVGMAVTVVSSFIFVLLDKPPFTAIGVALVFLIVIFTKNKNKNKDSHLEEDDHDIYLGDD